MTAATRGVEHTLARYVTSFAAAVSIGLAVLLPMQNYWSASGRELAEMRTEARLAAANLSQIAGLNPDLRRFDGHRMLGLIALSARQEEVEAWRVLDLDGTVLAERRDEMPAPILAVREPIYDSGRVIGHVELVHPLKPVIVGTAEVAALAALLGLAAFLALRLLPMRLLRRALERAAHLATHDILTGLPNRALFRDRLEQALAQGRRDGSAVAVLCLDLDHFKDVNDTLGHAAGDRLLRQAAQRLAACLRETDTLARLGGDEFAVIQTRVAQPRYTEILAQRMIEALGEPFDLDGHRAVVGVSVGVALQAAGATADPDQLLQDADLALYRAKAEGRNACRFFECDMNLRLRERKALEHDMREALARGEFRLNYQPQIGLDGRRVTGAEALLRWRHPVRGEVGPDRFIPLAEETGLIAPIGEWALREACRQAAAWPGGLCMAVNVSAVQFRHAGFVGTVRRVLAETGLDPARLELEVTEGVLLTDTEDTLATLERLRALGVAIAMDDFGTGYSSLGYLRKFRFDKIKIDRSFVRGLGDDRHADAIVRAVIRISRAMGVRANAEGVETESQAAMLREEGCEEVQGFLFGRPMEPELFAALLADAGEAAPTAA